MDKLILNIDGFKCFKEDTSFEFNNITLLTGANSVGKSSVVQSLLLLKTISQGSLSIPDSLIELDLNDEKYALELGTYDDIKNKSNDDYEDFMNPDAKDMKFVLNGAVASIRIQDNLEAGNKVQVSTDKQSLTRMRRYLDCCFVYLNAERQPPRYEYKNIDDNEFCDCHGKNTGDVIQKHEQDNCPPIRSFDFFEGNKWKVELDKWIKYIFPGVMLAISQSAKDSYQVKILGNAASNVGFGITYALPILVSGLIVPEGGMLIVENPEAHLHAKAQSNMGYFLARMAAAGVRVIIETHSEHIVNGIRRMIVEERTEMSANDMTIYFFQDKNGNKKIMNIGMDRKGNLSAFPEDFFDQVRQDTLAILRIDRTKLEQKR
ncbi:DUF3696 domain-containing protein [uncultured Bacteroides sp.]|uniref:DUF3696 domain-containing protein n=1 Tax=uncultured Bacteroides sp. TaxID=162156 RepID=UPI0026012390|nr:DUF3696 domain-containing protein [uncultured Bacteroides sp.]